MASVAAAADAVIQKTANPADRTSPILGDPRRLFHAPLVWLAIAATLGVVVDRYCPVPLPASLAVAGVSLIAWLMSRRSLMLALLTATLAAGAARNHVQQHVTPLDDISHAASPDGSPTHVRGILVAPPERVAGSDDVLHSVPKPESTHLVVDAIDIERPEGRQPASGRIAVYVPGPIDELFPGDVLELRGRLVAPHGPSNPGEFDIAAELRDRGIAAILTLGTSADSLQLVERRWRASVNGWLGRIHAACKKTLDEHLTLEPGLAAALLLGDGSGLSRSQWDQFLKSGVMHALAISGQHLFVLAAFLMFVRRFAFIRLTPAVVAIAAVLFAYALLTGGRPPAVRAAWMVLVGCLAVLARRQASPANTLAFAWLGVLFVNPADIFQAGCQLSFVAVALLQGVANPYVNQPVSHDPLADAAGGMIPQFVQRRWKTVLDVYLVSAVIWLGVTPLVLDRFHLISPIALVIGPPVVLATSVALAAGFVLLLTAPILGPLATPAALATDWSLWLCDKMIDVGLRVPGASFYVADPPIGWTWAVYLLLLIPWFVPQLRRPAWALVVVAVFGVGIAYSFGLFHRAEFRIAFLSVGHGGCTVIETGDGRVLVYDAGAITGPELTRRIVLPYLWRRGFTRIDELFISHADLDHFSGVPDLLDMMTVRRVNLTPTFSDRTTPGVRRVLDELKSCSVPTRIVKLGDSERDGLIQWDILHPPAVGPEGKENARSLVMLIRKGHFRALLTGDLEDAGVEQVLAQRPPGIDVFMVPHHGSRLASPGPLAAWARPRIAVSSQGRPRGSQSPAPIYEAVGAVYLTTYQDGAVEIAESRGGGFDVTTFRSKQTIHLAPTPVR